MADLPALTADARRFVASARVGRLGTVDLDGSPYLVPFCYVLLGNSLYTPLDKKPKRVPVERLRRVRNIIENDVVGIVVDHWSEDWSHLAYAQIRGRAALLAEGDDYSEAIRLLREKYVQYRTMPIDESPMIKIEITSCTVWGRIPPEPTA